MVQHADIDHTGIPGVGGGSGAVVQVKTAASTADDATTSASYVDTSLSLAFTPLFSDSILAVTVEGESLVTRVAGTESIRYAFYQILNSTNSVVLHEVVRGAILDAASANANTQYNAIGLRGYYTVNSTAARTFKLQQKSGVATNISTSVVGSRGGGGVTMTIMEVRP